jgi:hypothetical protein
MFDCLTTVGTEEIKNLRYIRVNAFPLLLATDENISYMLYT